MKKRGIMRTLNNFANTKIFLWSLKSLCPKIPEEFLGFSKRSLKERNLAVSEAANFTRRFIQTSLMVFLAMLLLFSVSVIGQENSSDDVNAVDPIDKAYQCLDKQIEDKEGISLSEALFGTYALGSKTKLLEKIDGEKKSNEECWPRGSCKIKDTAQAMLAYKLVGRNVSKIKDWLLSKTHGAKDLIWYLEIDIKDHIPSSCTLYYDSGENKLKINDIMKIEGTPGSCFETSFGGYWLKLKDNCIDKEFEISCENNFITTLVYQKQSGGTIYVSSETHLGDQGARTKEKVSSMCFGIGSACDYEGSLWASMVLKYNDEDASAYVPYLLALSSDNQKLFPAAFLYYIVGGQDKYSEIIQNQKLGKYWDIVGSPYNRFYDTSLAMLSLGGSDAPELDLTKKYLIESQTKEGCWNNNIKDTAFILFSGWPRDYSPVVKNASDENDTRELCKPLGYFCAAAGDCLASGGAIYDYACPIFREACCSIDVVEPSCEGKDGLNGLICGENQKCDGNIKHSRDGACCVAGACIDKEEENMCEDISKGECKSECLEDEEKKDDSCPILGDVCCVEKEEPSDKPSEKESSSLWWIILLIVLILLVIIGIVYRHKIQMWLYSRKRDRGSAGAGGPVRPQGGMPPGMMMPRPMPRYGPPGQRPPVRGGPAPRMTRRAKTPQDEELEETMRKLKEMSE